jgi:hypothetical protein
MSREPEGCSGGICRPCPFLVAMPNDTYLDNISNESLEVLSHFGAEAPQKLNAYACQLEDLLLKALEEQKTLQQQLGFYREQVETLVPRLKEATEARQAMENILADGDELIKYVSGYFGPEGPCPGALVFSRCRA